MPREGIAPRSGVRLRRKPNNRLTCPACLGAPGTNRTCISGLEVPCSDPLSYRGEQGKRGSPWFLYCPAEAPARRTASGGGGSGSAGNYKGVRRVGRGSPRFYPLRRPLASEPRLCAAQTSGLNYRGKLLILRWIALHVNHYSNLITTISGRLPVRMGGPQVPTPVEV